jgi:hypothetical protein
MRHTNCPEGEKLFPPSLSSPALSICQVPLSPFLGCAFVPPAQELRSPEVAPWWHCICSLVDLNDDRVRAAILAWPGARLMLDGMRDDGVDFELEELGREGQGNFLAWTDESSES